MSKVIVEVQGGCVTSVQTDDIHVDVLVLDYDNSDESQPYSVDEYISYLFNGVNERWNAALAQ